MKRVVLLISSLLFVFSGLFAQVAKYPPRVVVLFLGEKNPTFDESQFPHLSFYYTPNLKLTLREKTQQKSETKKALSSLTGIGAQAYDEYAENYTGTPEEINTLEIKSNNTYVFDKNGVLTAMSYSFDRTTEPLENLSLFASKKNMMGKAETITIRELSKEYIKKGKVTKTGKRIKADEPTIEDYFGLPLLDYQVADAAGKAYSMNDLVSSNPLTILYAIQLDKDFDLNKGMDSGAEKSGGQYAEDVLGTMAGQKKFDVLIRMENEFFGERIIL
jgi:hypothetical protein